MTPAWLLQIWVTNEKRRVTTAVFLHLHFYFHSRVAVFIRRIICYTGQIRECRLWKRRITANHRGRRSEIGCDRVSRPRQMPTWSVRTVDVGGVATGNCFERACFRRVSSASTLTHRWKAQPHAAEQLASLSRDLCLLWMLLCINGL